MPVINTVPSVQIQQEFLFAPSELVENQVAMIIAPNYQIVDDVHVGEYDGAETTYQYEDKALGADVDTASVTLNIHNARLRYYDSADYIFTTFTKNTINFESAVTSLSATLGLTAEDNKVLVTEDGIPISIDPPGIVPEFGDRGVKVGDVVKVEQNTGSGVVTHITKVAGFTYSHVNAEVSTANTDVSVVSDSYTGNRNRNYKVTVTEVDGTAVTANIESTTRDDVEFGVSFTEGVQKGIGSFGIQLTFNTAAAFTAGDVFYITAVAAHRGASNGIVLSRGLPTSSFDLSGTDLRVSLYIEKAITVPEYKGPGATWYTASDTYVVLDEDLISTEHDFTDDGVARELPVTYGQVHLSYRALLYTHTYGRSEISSLSQVSTLLGKIVPENPLAFAVYHAMLNATNQPIGYIATEGESYEAYTKALELIKENPRSYFLVPCTEDQAVLDAVKAHVLRQSDAIRSKFRIAWFAQTTNRLRELTADLNEPLMVSISDGFGDGVDTIEGTSYNENFDFTDIDVRIGDKVRVPFGDPMLGQYNEYTVVGVNGSSIRLYEKLGAEEGETSIQIWRTQTDMQEAEFVASRAQYWNNRRIRNIFAPGVQTAFGPAPTWTACAALAGLASSVAPHQPLTNVELNGITGLSRIGQFSQEALDEMAKWGTWVLTQDPRGGPVFTRLDLTTEVIDANRWQHARTVNADSISFGFNSRLQGLVGSTNITERILQVIHNEIMTTGAYYMSESRTPNLGPQLLSIEIVDPPKQSELMQDTVEVGVALSLPYEFVTLKMQLLIS